MTWIRGVAVEELLSDNPGCSQRKDVCIFKCQFCEFAAAQLSQVIRT